MHVYLYTGIYGFSDMLKKDSTPCKNLIREAQIYIYVDLNLLLKTLSLHKILAL